MMEQDRNDAFSRFGTGRSRILVCTASAEESVDVVSCAFVVRVNAIHTTNSHVQGVGRVRLPMATIYDMENDPHEEVHPQAQGAPPAKGQGAC